MTKKGDDKADQRELIPLSAEELKAAPLKLAKAIKALEDLEEEHKESRSEQAAERKKLRGTIASLAGQIRSQGR